MKKSEMICRNCNRFDGSACRLNPVPVVPSFHPEWKWCAQGAWFEWNEHYREMVPHHWGEWDWDETGRKPKE